MSIFVKVQCQMLCGSPGMHPWYYLQIKYIKKSDREVNAFGSACLFL